MKKSLILLGMLSIGYTYAQEGTVGINTENPKATLDIQPSATNLTGTTNEGILAPRLSKTRIANIEASKLTEGTLVYATDDTESPISAYAGNDSKVAKITEKGYYFYNGTEWVKVQHKDEGSKWEYDSTQKVIKLKYLSDGVTERREDGKLLISDTGGVISNGLETFGWSVMKTGTPTNVMIGRSNIRSTFNFNYIWRDSLNRAIVQSMDEKPSYAGSFSFDNASGTFIFTGSKRSIANGDTYTDYNQIFKLNAQKQSLKLGLISSVDQSIKENENKRTLVVDNYTSTESNTKAAIGVYRIAAAANTAKLGSIDLGTKTGGNYVTIGSMQAILESDSNTSDGITNNISGGLLFSTLPLSNDLTNDMAEPVERMRINTLGNVGIGTTAPSEKLEVAGKIKTSSLAQTGAGDRVVYADENGILKTGGSIASNNGVQTQSGMTCTAANAGKINYTTIQKDGKDVGVFGFCMQKGTDYVWAYMLGGSNIYGTSANGAAFGQGL